MKIVNIHNSIIIKIEQNIDFILFLQAKDKFIYGFFYQLKMFIQKIYINDPILYIKANELIYRISNNRFIFLLAFIIFNLIFIIFLCYMI